MNKESKQPPISPELEARIVALVLGEASDFEREDLERLIQERPELAAFKADVQRTHGMLQVIGSGDPIGTEKQQDEDWKLSADKRGHVLDVIAGKATVDDTPQSTQQVVDLSDKAKRLLEGNTFFGYSKAAAVLCAVGSIATLALLGLMVNGTHRNWRSASSMPSAKIEVDGSEGAGDDVYGDFVGKSAGGTDMKFRHFDEADDYVESTEGEVSNQQTVTKSLKKKGVIAGFAEPAPTVELPAEIEVVEESVSVTVPDGGTVLSGGLKTSRRRGGQGSDRESNSDQSAIPSFHSPAPQQDPFGSSMLFGASPAGQDPFANDMPAVHKPKQPAPVQSKPAQPARPEPSSGLGGLADADGIDDEMGMGDTNGGGDYFGSALQLDIAKNESGSPQGGMGGAGIRGIGMGGGFAGGGGFGNGDSFGGGGRSSIDGKKNAAIAGEKSSPTIGFDGISGLPTNDLDIRFNDSLGVASPFDDELSDRSGNMLWRVEQERLRAEGLRASVGADLRGPGQQAFQGEGSSIDRFANGSAYGHDGAVPKYRYGAETPGSSGKPRSAENAAKESLQKLAESNKLFGRGWKSVGGDQGNGQQSSGQQSNAQRDGEEAGSQQGQSSQSNRKGQFRTTKIVNGRTMIYEWTPGNPVPKIVADSGLGVAAGVAVAPVANEESDFYGDSLLADYESAKGFNKTKRTSRVKSAAPSGLKEKKAQDESFSTFSLHVSDVSFKLAQSALSRGEWPEAAKIRVEEFVNAFDYGDRVPCQSEKVACQLEQTIHPFLQQRNLVRVSMRTAAEGRSGDTPLRLTLLLDNSGSMERIDRQETVRRAFALLAAQLKPIDQVTLISFARQPRLLADKVSGAQSKQLVRLIDALPSEGGTNIVAALQLAFEKAREQQLENAQNRIILLTDGAVNLGNANPESLSQMITKMRDAGIAFDAAGISADGLNDEVLEALTRKGDGRYYLLDSVESADDGFARQIAGALRPAAKNVKVQVEFNPKRVGRYKLLGFEKHRLKKEDFRNDQVDAAEMAAAEAGVAMYQFETKADGEGDVGSVSVRFRDLASGQMVEHCWPIPYEANTQRPELAAPSVRIATTAAMFAAKLRGGPLGGVVDLKTLSNLVAGLPERHRNAKRVQQLQQMIQQARQLNGT